MNRKEKLLQLERQRLLLTAVEKIRKFVGSRETNVELEQAGQMLSELTTQIQTEIDQIESVPVTKLFVYGTLKRSEHNHSMLGDNASFFGEDAINAKLVIIDNGLPFLVEDPESTVKGEVWEVEEPEYRQIRQMELYAGYIEKEVTTEKGEKCIAYFVAKQLEQTVLERGIVAEEY